MGFFSNFLFYENFNEYSFTLIFFNILSYVFILINIFLIFFIFDMKYVKALNELKFFGNLPFITIFLTLIILSFAGVPPLLGFLMKFLVFIFITAKSNYLFLFVFIFFNMFAIYFYIQNLRFIVSKNINNRFFFKNSYIYINNTLIFILNVFNFFNVMSIFYFEELLIYLNLLSSSFYF